MKNFILLLLIYPNLILSQNIDDFFKNRKEIYFGFKFKNKQELNKLSKIISLDHKITADSAFAFANKKEFNEFIKYNIPYKIIKFKKIKYELNSFSSNWDFYPSYIEYTQIMQSFADSFPEICKLHKLGTLSSGREILFIQISDNVNKKENEPNFLYTSSMHGNELTGYVLMLRLIEYILKNYNINSNITTLVNEINIWINPLANPDGAYAGGNQDVWSATRSNANGIDLNRNFPDPQDGPNPDGNLWQEETIIFMGISDTLKFNLSSNIHTGAELINYPWDTWSNLTADNNWWNYVCREYADSCQTNSSSNYFNDQNNGITNGYDWYEVNGGRQDYMNYYNHCRESTLEISSNKIPPPNQLPIFWEKNYPSLINYMKQALYGIRGLITDSITSKPLKAKIEIIGHDVDSSHVYSLMPIGNYHRYLFQGNYNIKFSKSGYYSKTINVNVQNNTSTIRDIQLVPLINNTVFNNYNDKYYNNFNMIGKKINFKKGSLNLKIKKNKKFIIIEK